MWRALPAAILMAVSMAAQAAELTLFDIPLRSASREQIRTAIKSAGGLLQSKTRDTDNFDARNIGLPGAQSLEVIFLEDKFVLAQYHLRFRSPSDDERLRKMLVSKYGNPSGRDFGAQYVSDGKYVWSFDGNMNLVATKEFFGGFNLLTYVNRAEQARLERIVKEQDDKAVQGDAAAKKSVF